MASICNRCGNTSNLPGTRNCSVCGAPLPAGAAPTQAMLVTSGGRRYRLSSSGETLIGSRGCAILLSDPSVAPKHARISPTGSGFIVEDLGGGTQLNAAPVAGPTPLQNGDTVSVGAVHLQYQGPGAIAAKAQPPPVVIPQQKPVLPPTPPKPLQAPVKPVVPGAQLPQPAGAPATPVVAATPARGILADGQVLTADPERQDMPPFDIGRALVILSVVLVLLGIVAVVVAASLALWIGLLICGLGSVGCMLPMMFPLVFSAFRPLLGWLGGRQTVPILNFQVLDSSSNMPLDVMLIRKRGGGGSVRIGDKVRVRGRRQASTGLIHAYRVEIYESGGHPTNYGLEGHKPWPIWPGLLALGLTIAGLVAAVGYVLSI